MTTEGFPHWTNPADNWFLLRKKFSPRYWITHTP